MSKIESIKMTYTLIKVTEVVDLLSVYIKHANKAQQFVVRH
jgi:hypothetical protein